MKPPTIEAQVEPLSRRQSRNAVQAASAGRRSAQRLNDATGPTRSVYGANATASPGVVVVQRVLAPTG